jgi:hypothetical protein
MSIVHFLLERFVRHGLTLTVLVAIRRDVVYVYDFSEAPSVPSCLQGLSSVGNHDRRLLQHSVGNLPATRGERMYR